MEIAIAPPVVVPEVLTKDNYGRWSILMRHYLVAKNLWDIVQSSQLPNCRNTREREALALYAIKISCGAEMFNRIKDMDSAKSVWDELALACPQQIPVYYNTDELHEVVCPDVVDPYKETLPGQYWTTLREFTSYGYDSRGQWFLRNNQGPRSRRQLYLALRDAITAGQEDITPYLYSQIPPNYLRPENGDHGFNLLQEFITKKMFNLAYELLNNVPELALYRPSSNSIPIILTLAQTPPPFFRGTQLGIWGQCAYNCIRVDLVKLGKVPAENESCGREMERLFQTCVGNMGLCFKLCVAIPLHICCCQPWDAFGRILTLYILCVVAQPVVALLLGAAFLHIPLALVFLIPVITLLIVMATALLISGALPILVSVISKLRFSFGKLLAWSLAKHIYDLRVMDAYASEVLRFIVQQLSTLDHNRLVQSGAVEAIFQAIKNGIPDIVSKLTIANVGVLWSSADPEDSKNMFACAITYRQEEVVRFLYLLGASEDTNMVLTIDEEGNNILHLVAKPAPHSQLGGISGAALQLQSEVRWFKSVEDLVPQFYNEQKNKDGETPFQVFVREHKSLLKEAEEWMKKMAGSSTVVASLIITMMFGAAFAVHGWNDQDSGVPILIVIVSDAVSLFASSSSVLMFLGILTSRYAYDDFLKSLPTKLIIGISLLFISIATMMVAFCAGLFIMLRGRLSVIIPITLLAGIPVTIFVLLQFPLLVEIYTSTFRPDIFKNRPRLSWIGKMHLYLINKI